MCEPTYVDVKLSHWWPGGRGAAGDAARRAAAAFPAAAVQHTHTAKLVGNYHSRDNAWPGVVLLLAVFTTGGRAHPAFAGALNGWCKRAAERRGGPVGPLALAGGLRYRVGGLLACQVQRAVHRLTAGGLDEQGGLSRPEAGEPAPWEAAVAAAGAGGGGDL